LHYFLLSDTLTEGVFKTWRKIVVQLVAFDNNGTVFNDLRITYLGSVKVFEAFNLLPPTLEQYRNTVGGDFMKFYHNYGIPVPANEDEKKKLSADIGDVFWSHIKENIWRSSFRPDVAATISELQRRGIRTAMISAMNESELLEELDHYGFCGVFDPIFGGVKDKAPVMEHLCRSLKINPHSTLYVGDTVEDMKAAREAGVIPVGMGAPDAYHSAERLRKLTSRLVDNLWDVIAIVKNLNC